MRIVAGSAKGVRLGPVPPSVRPISDRAREGLFSSLGPVALEGAVVLDLYAGTGAAGIEALSRGAERALFVDRAPAAVSAIKRNLAATKLAARGEVVPSAVARFTARDDLPGAPYDLVICDPPYDLGSPDVDDVLRELADGWLRPETLDRRIDPGSQEFHACHSATLGGREAAPLRRQPRVPVPAGRICLSWP